MTHKYNFQEYLETYIPQHKTSIDPQFLMWFIGFFEGDGNIAQWHNRTTPKTEPVNRFAFSIEQKNNTRVLETLRSTLGFGKVTKHKRGATYRVGKKEDLLRILIILHGNLTLSYRRRTLDIILDNMLRAGWDLPPSLYRRELPLIPPSLESSWIAGFFDADGRFYSNRRQDHLSDNSIRLRIQLKFYVTQRKESAEALEQIGELFNPGGWKIYSITSGHSSVEYGGAEPEGSSRLELNRGSAHDQLILYLKTYPLKGLRRIDAKTFALLRTRQLQRGSRPETERMARRTARLLDRLSMTQKKL